MHRVKQGRATAPLRMQASRLLSGVLTPPTWQRLVTDALSPADQVEISGYTQLCVRQNQP